MNNLIDEVALFKMQYGMYVVSTNFEKKINGQIATTVIQVTNDPIKIEVCLSKNTYTHELLQQSKVFGVSVLSQNTTMQFIGNFGYKSGRDIDKYNDIKYEIGVTGSPLLQESSVVVLEGKVIQALDIVTHTIFVGELVQSKKIADGEALSYEYYHSVLKGKSPENAPTYIKNAE